MNEISQLVINVPIAVAEAVANLLTEEGSGMEERDQDTASIPSAGTREFVVWVPTTDVQRRVDKVEKLLVSLGEMGLTAQPWTWKAEPADMVSWQEAYKKYFTVNRPGRLFVIKPSWETYKAQKNELVIELDPGMAFGTGLHASTKLVMRIMERLARFHNPRTILDLGTGTGILAIAAAKLWPTCDVLAVDNDETAVQICRENIKRNGVEKKIFVEHGSAAAIDGRFQLILANLQLEALTALHPHMREYMQDDGNLIVSGLLVDHAKQISVLYSRDLRMEPKFSEDMEEWRAVHFSAR